MGIPVQEVAARSVIIAEMMCAGASQSEIAERLGAHRNSVAKWQELPEVIEEIERIQADARKVARRLGGPLVPKAVGVWTEALAATRDCPECGAGVPDHTTRLRAADSVADRFGLPKMEVLEASGVTLGDKSDHELMLLTLDGAAKILDMQGHHKLAAGIRATLAPTVPYTITQEGGGDE